MFPVAIPEGPHPFPSRTRKLSPPRPPVPIPNTEVKPSKADATAAVRPWESRTLPGYKQSPMIKRSSGSCFFNSDSGGYFSRAKRRDEAAGPVAANSPTVLAPPPGVGSPAARGGAPPSPRHPQGRWNPLAKTSDGALRSLVDRSALMVASHLISFSRHSARNLSHGQI
jgi:hypothetical protein